MIVESEKIILVVWYKRKWIQSERKEWCVYL